MTTRGVTKQIAQALDADSLSKMDAVDILSVLKRIENLEKMAQGGKKKSSNQGRQATMNATMDSGSGGSIPNPSANET